MTQLEQRVTKLEKKLQHYRIFFMIMITAIFTITLMSAGKNNPISEVLKANSFQVVDDNGRVIAELGKSNGNGSLITYTPTGKKLVGLFTSEGGSGSLSTFDADGDILFGLGRTSGGGGYMALYNADSKEIAEFGVTNSQGGYMKINDKFSDKLALITNTIDGGGYFSLLNNNTEKIRLSTPDAGGRIGISNKRNKRVAYIGAQDNQDGNITIYNSNEETIGSIPK